MKGHLALNHGRAHAPLTMESPGRETLVRLYFDLGLSYDDIVYMLAHDHNVFLGVRQLKRILRRLELRRRQYDNLADVVQFIRQELRSSGRLHGYRTMYVRCQRMGIRVPMETVRLILQLVDPRGVQIRSSGRLQRRSYFAKGPNYIWHLDGYDKLKRFGLCINGCICGFSRYIVWMNVYGTNSNPKIIAGYFIDAVKRENGCPKIVRSDFGTENVVVRDIQRFLRRNATDDTANRVFIDGASTSNQRIEYWWAFLRRQNSHFWIEFFRHLEETGEYNGGFLDKNLLQFCFMGLIQDELDMVADIWNQHTIRPSSNQHVPSGRPSMMYLTPALWGVENEICFVSNEDIDLCRQEAEFRSTIPCDEDVYNVCVEIMRRDARNPPTTVQNALELYAHLRQEILRLL